MFQNVVGMGKELQYIFRMDIGTRRGRVLDWTLNFLKLVPGSLSTPLESWISYRTSRNSRDTWRIWALGGLWGQFRVNIIERIAQKLRIMVLLHFGLVTFRIRSGMRKPIIFMVFGPGGSLETPGYSK